MDHQLLGRHRNDHDGITNGAYIVNGEHLRRSTCIHLNACVLLKYKRAKTCLECSNTGGYIPDQGEPVPAGQSFVFMVVNVCPSEWPNVNWCSQSANPDNVNHYGYRGHFNLEDGAGQVTDIGWADKNPEVTYEWVNCDDYAENEKTPNSYNFQNGCMCGKYPNMG